MLSLCRPSTLEIQEDPLTLLVILAAEPENQKQLEARSSSCDRSGIMGNRGNYPNMILFQASELL